MGGKDAIVVDENIDTDLAAESIITSHLVSQAKNVLHVHVPSYSSVYDEVLEKR